MSMRGIVCHKIFQTQIQNVKGLNPGVISKG